MTKILVLADSPTIASGFAQVSKNILRDLHKTGLYGITVIGIGYDGEGYDPVKFPYRIIPAVSGMSARYNDPYGRQRVLDELETGYFDIFFTIQDLMVIREMIPALVKSKAKHGFKTMMYIPVDSNLDTKPEWVMDVLPFIDFPVAYTFFAKKELQKFSTRIDIKVCYHGVDTSLFKPLPDLDRARVLNEFFKPAVKFIDEADVDKRFKILNVNRNQTRKDYLRTFQVFKRFKEQYPQTNPLLMVVAEIKDQGGDLMLMAKQLGLEYGVDWVTPMDYNALHGYPVEAVAMWYNCADVVFSSTLGEGFGLSTVEAMACGIPVVFPDNTALTEILGNGKRGDLIKCGQNASDLICMGALDSSLIRPRIDIEDAVRALSGIRCGRSEKALGALEWAKSMDWSKVNEFWVDLFAKAGKK